MEQSDLDSFLALRQAAVLDLGVEDLRAGFGDGILFLSGRVRESGLVADLTARVHVDFDQERIRFAVGRALTYGYLATPAPLLAHRILTAGLAGSDQAAAAGTGAGTGTGTGTGTGAGTASGTGRWEAERDPTTGPWASTVRGLGEIELDPLALTLWHILP